jgi:hypothetical protein
MFDRITECHLLFRENYGASLLLYNLQILRSKVKITVDVILLSIATFIGSY